MGGSGVYVSVGGGVGRSVAVGTAVGGGNSVGSGTSVGGTSVGVAVGIGGSEVGVSCAFTPVETSKSITNNENHAWRRRIIIHLITVSYPQV